MVGLVLLNKSDSGRASLWLFGFSGNTNAFWNSCLRHFVQRTHPGQILCHEALWKSQEEVQVTSEPDYNHQVYGLQTSLKLLHRAWKHPASQRIAFLLKLGQVGLHLCDTAGYIFGTAAEVALSH